MDNFLKDYVSMIVACHTNNVDEEYTYRELTDGDYNDIVNAIENDDSIWDTFDYAVLDILESYKNE